MKVDKKQPVQAKTTPRSQTSDAPVRDWLEAIDAAAPCGADLEYDPAFVVLSAQVATRMDAQYGDFVGAAEPVNWSDVDRDCRRLMQRSKDIRVAVLFARCRTRLAGVGGLAEGLGLLASWLEAFPDTIHPQPGVDDDRDAAQEIRLNALQALTDAEGLLSDVREISIARSGIVRLQVRDVERAFAQPRANDALSPESVTRQLADLRAQQPAALNGFDAAIASLDAIEAWNRDQLGACAADLSALRRVLRRVTGEAEGPSRPPPQQPSDDASDTAAAVAHSVDEPIASVQEADPTIQASVAHAGPAQPWPTGRDAALEHIRTARLWFEVNEPSSPIALLLRRAEFFVGKSYAETVGAIPADLIEKWSAVA